MKLCDLNEFALIDRMAKRFPDSSAIGDDCAVLSGPNGLCTLMTTDILIEDVHFLRRGILAGDLGYKALAVNLSDIAAMGGIPRSFLMSLALPPDIEVEWLDDFIDGMSALAKKHNVRLIGGDTTRSPQPIVINITAIGDIPAEEIKLRSSAKVGDIVAVTDYLGDSAAGLKTIQENILETLESQKLRERHCRPIPALEEGRWLATNGNVHAMMDVSDGLHTDIQRILDRSACGAKIDLADLPLSPELTLMAETVGWNARELAVAGGEDYCLLCTIAESDFEACARNFIKQFGKPLYKVGRITNRPGVLDYFENGRQVRFSPHGFQHFSEE